MSELYGFGIKTVEIMSQPWMFDGRCLKSEVKMSVEVLDKKAEISFARNRGSGNTGNLF
jgi:hypothetical protein